MFVATSPKTAEAILEFALWVDNVSDEELDRFSGWKTIDALRSVKVPEGTSGDWYERLAERAGLVGCTVERGNVDRATFLEIGPFVGESGGALGVTFNGPHGPYKIVIDESLPDDLAAVVLVHELAHAVSPLLCTPGVSRSLNELGAQFASSMVLQDRGYDVTDWLRAYALGFPPEGDSEYSLLPVVVDYVYRALCDLSL